MKNGNELYDSLRQCTGSETVYHHSQVKSFFYTEGVREFAREAGQGAYWLLDILATEPKIRNAVMELGFHMVELHVTDEKNGKVVVRLDTGRDPVYVRQLDYTDCPVKPVTESDPDGFWKFYLVPQQVGPTNGIMALLPQEY